MNKESYYRVLVLSGTTYENKKFLNMLPNWTFKTKNFDGIVHNCIENKKLNVQVLFDQDIKQSKNVLPIDSTIGDIYHIYEDGFDMSDSQKSNIKEDILFSLCIQINDTINSYNENVEDIEKTINILCGIVPSEADKYQI